MNEHWQTYFKNKGISASTLEEADIGCSESGLLIVPIFDNKSGVIGYLTYINPSITPTMTLFGKEGGLCGYPKLKNKADQVLFVDGLMDYLFAIKHGLCVNTVFIPDKDLIPTWVSSYKSISMINEIPELITRVPRTVEFFDYEIKIALEHYFANKDKLPPYPKRKTSSASSTLFDNIEYPFLIRFGEPYLYYNPLGTGRHEAMIIDKDNNCLLKRDMNIRNGKYGEWFGIAELFGKTHAINTFPVTFNNFEYEPVHLYDIHPAIIDVIKQGCGDLREDVLLILALHLQFSWLVGYYHTYDNLYIKTTSDVWAKRMMDFFLRVMPTSYKTNKFSKAQNLPKVLYGNMYEHTYNAIPTLYIDPARWNPQIKGLSLLVGRPTGCIYDHGYEGVSSPEFDRIRSAMGNLFLTYGDDVKKYVTEEKVKAIDIKIFTHYKEMALVIFKGDLEQAHNMILYIKQTYAIHYKAYRRYVEKNDLFAEAPEDENAYC